MERKDIEVTTPSGKLRGSVKKSCLGYDYFAFKGIPYAQPPLGELRFKDPIPIEPWNGIRDAREFGPRAAQQDAASGQVIGSEDCLYLNVYTRNLDATAPVMFWVHGGAFISGSADEEAGFGPDYLLDRGVVLVTFNYRVGVLGFLNLEHELAPGNQGLKDQAAALAWLGKHVRCFGGDPDNMTAFGGSAGAGSVHFLTMSPMTKNLFHRAICQSGNALCSWAVMENPKEKLEEYLEALGCKKRDPKDVLKFLRSVDHKLLVETQGKLLTPTKWLQLSFPFGPCVDSKSSKPFLPVHPDIAAKESIQMPFLTGYNSLEGIIALNFFQFIDINDLNDNLENYFTKKNKSTLLKEYNLTINELRKFYMDSKNITMDDTKGFLEMWSDLIFVDSIHTLAKIQCRRSPASTYLYKLNFDKNDFIRNLRINKSIEGVNHGDELIYLFKTKAPGTEGIDQLQAPGVERVMKQMVEMWTNFAKTGRPTVTTSELIPTHWLPLDSGDVLRYLNIGEDLRMEKQLSIEQRYSFAQNTKGTY